jgi:hypothetical protein
VPTPGATGTARQPNGQRKERHPWETRPRHHVAPRWGSRSPPPPLTPAPTTTPSHHLKQKTRNWHACGTISHPKHTPHSSRPLCFVKFCECRRCDFTRDGVEGVVDFGGYGAVQRGGVDVCVNAMVEASASCARSLKSMHPLPIGLCRAV